MIEEKVNDKYMKQLKRRMENWREVILPVNSILLWEKPWYPCLILGITTTIFLIIWTAEPTFLTILSMTLLVLALIDYLVPVLCSTFISSTTWTGQKERKLEDICQQLSDKILHLQSSWKYLLDLRSNRPNLYYGSLTLGLGLLAWLGNVVNNLLLMYLILNTILLMPGLKYKGRAKSLFKQAYIHLMHRKIS